MYLFLNVAKDAEFQVFVPLSTSICIVPDIFFQVKFKWVRTILFSLLEEEYTKEGWPNYGWSWGGQAN